MFLRSLGYFICPILLLLFLNEKSEYYSVIAPYASGYEMSRIYTGGLDLTSLVCMTECVMHRHSLNLEVWFIINQKPMVTSWSCFMSDSRVQQLHEATNWLLVNKIKLQGLNYDSALHTQSCKLNSLGRVRQYIYGPAHSLRHIMQ